MKGFSVPLAILTLLALASCEQVRYPREQLDMMRGLDEERLLLVDFRTNARGFTADFRSTSPLAAFLDRGSEGYDETPFKAVALEKGLYRIIVERPLEPGGELWICVRNREGFYYYTSPSIGSRFTIPDAAWALMTAGDR